MQVVRYVGRDVYADRTYLAMLACKNNIIIDSVSDTPNVTIGYTFNGCPVSFPASADVRDLIDLAVSVYISDELIARNVQSDAWSRDISFLIPVNNCSKWGSGQSLLTDTLQFLSADRFSFSWDSFSSLGTFTGHRTQLHNGFDDVCLFSGGIDSLVGAYQTLSLGRRVLLVGHQADGITAAVQNQLFSELQRRFHDSVGFVQCRVARSHSIDHLFQLPLKCEQSHRVRSFLFLSLAVGIAQTLGINSVLIPENGLIALNIPLIPSRLGSLSTRTAHPKYLSLFHQTMLKVGTFQGEIRNPFMFVSKTDMLAQVKDKKLKRMLAKTVSCAHPDVFRWAKKSDKRKRHCGYCVPCLYRRAALSAASMDTSDDYVIDVFRDLASLSATKRADLRALTRFAKRISLSPQGDRQAMVLEHGYFAPEVSGVIGPTETHDYVPWARMLSRWSDSFLETVGRKASASAKRVIGT